MTRRKSGVAINGWLVIDKPEGMSSATVVGKVRRLTNARKAGHAGTLDPMATGVLPIALGEATKTVDNVMNGGKRYEFTVRWGAETATDDQEGDVVATTDARPDKAAIEAVLPQFLGEIEQIPPAYSAIKVDGKRAYALAREGREVALQPRLVRIDGLELIEIVNEDQARFAFDCGRGTYARALARDIARAAGTLGHITALRRTKSGPFAADRAIGLDKLEHLVHSAALDEVLMPVETALDDIPALALTEAQADRLRHGQSVRVLHVEDGPVRARWRGKLIALAQVRGGEVRTVRGFNLS